MARGGEEWGSVRRRGERRETWGGSRSLGSSVIAFGGKGDVVISFCRWLGFLKEEIEGVRSVISGLGMQLRKNYKHTL